MALPPPTGDALDYDNIALNLRDGRGFGTDWDNPEWRQPYMSEANVEEGGALSRSGGFALTAYRAPLVPFVMSAAYHLPGSRFRAVRVLNILAIVFASMLTLHRMVTTSFPSAAFAFVALTAADSQLLAASGTLLTEPLTLLALTSLWLLATRAIESPSLLRYGLAGAAFGAAILARHVFIALLPVLSIVFLASEPRESSGRRFGFILFFWLTALIVSAPWMARNIRVTNSFLPLGTQPDIAGIGGYSPEALEARGCWAMEAFSVHIQRALERGIAGEVEAGNRARAYVSEWLESNWLTVPRLASEKLASGFWTGISNYQRLLTILAVAALFLISRRPDVQLGGAIYLTWLGTITLTYNDWGGRFLLPLHNVLAALGALVLQGIWGRVGKQRALKS